MGKARARRSGPVVASLGRAHPGRVEVWRMGTLRFAHPTICALSIPKTCPVSAALSRDRRRGRRSVSKRSVISVQRIGHTHTRRKPTELLRLSGLFQLRLTARALAGLLFQDPPRKERPAAGASHRLPGAGSVAEKARRRGAALQSHAWSPRLQAWRGPSKAEALDSRLQAARGTRVDSETATAAGGGGQ